MIYTDVGLYIESKTSILEKIQAYEAILVALRAAMLTVAETSGIEEYYLDDGQTIIKKRYRDPNQVYATIQAVTRLKNSLIQDYNDTHVVRLVDSKNFPTNRY